jgi:hypothetical protein
MEQIGVENTALEEMRKIVGKPEYLPTSMSNLILGTRNFQSQNSITTLFRCTTLAKRQLSVYETKHLLMIENALSGFDIVKEIEDRSKRYVKLTMIGIVPINNKYS